jgi:hypothetical protein
MTRTLLALLVASTVSLAGAAAAHAQREPERSRATGRYAPRPQHFDFDDDPVVGELPQHDATLMSRRPARQPSLIRLREDFVPELLRSAAEL